MPKIRKGYGNWKLAAGNWLLETGCRQLATGDWLLATGYSLHSNFSD